VVESEVVGALDPAVLAPGVGSAVGSTGVAPGRRDHQPVRHAQKAGALEREVEAARRGQILDHRSAAGLLPPERGPPPVRPFEGERGTDPVGDECRRTALVEQREDHRALRHAGGGAGQAIEVAVGEGVLLAAEVLDDPLPGAATLAHALDQAEVAVDRIPPPDRRADPLLTHVPAAKQHVESQSCPPYRSSWRNYLAAHPFTATNPASTKSIS